ncbi:MAG TPA: hypothetical protein VHA74_00895 [Candidatus Dojkabacteria bacterium]|nr:hypothetical protein [Candidatus Dojkabacteria bacterium]
MNSKNMRYVLIIVFVEILLLGVFGTIYASVQHALRSYANDPQTQIAMDAVEDMKTGRMSAPNMSGNSIDITKSLAPFYIVYNKDKQITSSTALLNGTTPTVPQGVLDYAKEHGEDRITWEPQDGVRIATIVQYYKDKNEGFVVVGRSLKEVEIREASVLYLSMLGFILTSVASILFVFMLKGVDDMKVKK